LAREDKCGLVGAGSLLTKFHQLEKAGMKVNALMLLGFLLSYSLSGFASEVDVFDATLRAKACGINKYGGHDCVFDFGQELKFTIAGVGDEDAGLLIEKADFDAEGFYLKYGVLHHCLIVSHADSMLGFSFINPKTAGVYRTYQQCFEDYQ
jgi:hypothetical protein